MNEQFSTFKVRAVEDELSVTVRIVRCTFDDVAEKEAVANLAVAAVGEDCAARGGIRRPRYAVDEGATVNFWPT